jgi:oxalate decarboxylase/phosphoglucose isomerase-like protein (cupin superfamily)
MHAPTNDLPDDHTEEANMPTLEKGITTNGTGFAGKTWNILGQVYFPKAICDSTFAFETNSDPGQFVPVHIHPTQDEFILVQEGVLDLKLDGVWTKAHAGDLVRMPRGIPHGYFNKSDKPARALFWVSPMQKLEALFNALHNVTDIPEVIRLSSLHEVDFLPEDANA